ncbi:DUF4232 domain-containing protein [Streptomyces sp. NPDC004542]|uniref:DUF4232 domain-containing protein n=1 Tax=Streptomyces sp. NPDC004542 TaxID=3154281 RepID=UPI0033A460EE
MALTACAGNSDTASRTTGSSQASAAGSGVDAKQGSQDTVTGESAPRSDSAADKSSHRNDDSIARCDANDLKITIENRESGAGATSFQLLFQNSGSSPCSLTGFPGVSFRGRDGVQIGNAASRDSGSQVTKVTLTPNGHAAAEVKARNGQSGSSKNECRLTNAAFLRVYAPGSKDQFNLPWNVSECSNGSAHGLNVGAVHSVR